MAKKVYRNQDFIKCMLAKDGSAEKLLNRRDRSGSVKGRVNGKCIHVILMEGGRKHATLTTDSFDKAVAMVDEWKKGGHFPAGIHFDYR